ncbi:MAG: FtsQ-type POTRA domain-containing protein [bacterium]
MSVFLQRQTVKRRRRWADKLRQVERALLSMLIMVAGLAALYGLYRLVFLGPAFSLEKIVVDGNWKYLSAAEVADLSGVHRGENLFWMSVGDIYRRLTEEPWVKEAAVRRRLPDTLYIYIEEFRPVAIVSSDGFYYVDDEATVLKKVEAYDDKDMPLITGIDIEGGGMSDDGVVRMKASLELIAAFERSQFGSRNGLAEVNFDEANGYSVFTRREPMQVLIGKSDFADRMRKIDRMEAAITARQGRIQYMLADEEGRITVKYRPA